MDYYPFIEHLYYILIIRNWREFLSLACCSEVVKVMPMVYSSAQPGIPSTHRFKTPSVKPEHESVHTMFSLFASKLVLCHVSPDSCTHVITTSDCELYHGRKLLELGWSHLFIQLGHLQKIHVSIFCIICQVSSYMEMWNHFRNCLRCNVQSSHR